MTNLTFSPYVAHVNITLTVTFWQPQVLLLSMVCIIQVEAERQMIFDFIILRCNIMGKTMFQPLFLAPQRVQIFFFGYITIYYISISIYTYEMLCRIWYHLYNLKNLKNTLLVSNFSESNAPPWIFFKQIYIRLVQVQGTVFFRRLKIERFSIQYICCIFCFFIFRQFGFS